MADIAMLVAEEYERRVKSSRKAGDDASTDLASCVSVLAQTLQEKIGKEKMEFLVKWVKEEPRSQIGLQASHGFFSA